ncbi:MAG: ATP synthase F1 subunit epsilon [Rickettsiales bacterium]|nr:ATP synthase F1 subunit epsilon [Rickettsiales bacterium]
MKLEITTPGKLIYKGDINQATMPGEAGEFGVLPDHAPLISTLKNGVIGIVEENNSVRKIFVAGGFAEVNQAECSVLASEAFDLENTSKDFAIDKLEHAKIRLKHAQNDLEKLLAEEEIELYSSLSEAI